MASDIINVNLITAKNMDDILDMTVNHNKTDIKYYHFK